MLDAGVRMYPFLVMLWISGLVWIFLFSFCDMHDVVILSALSICCLS